MGMIVSFFGINGNIYFIYIVSAIVTIYTYNTLTNFMQKDPQMYVLLPAVHININNIIHLLFIVGFCGVSWDMDGRCVSFDSIVRDRGIIGLEETLSKVLID